MNAPSTLRRFLTASRIRNLVSPLSFKRGENYLAQRRVSSVIENNEALTATVQGTELYVMRLEAKAGELAFRWQRRAPTQVQPIQLKLMRAKRNVSSSEKANPRTPRRRSSADEGERVVHRAETGDMWTALISRVRVTHKAKRNSISAAADL